MEMCQINCCLNSKRAAPSDGVVAVIPAQAGTHPEYTAGVNLWMGSRLRGNDSPRSMRAMRGLTLIEVLIALAIVSIAMTAIIKATSQNILGTRYLQDKTIAMWVGEQVLNEARVGVLTLSQDQQTQTTTMLGQDWPWHASQEETPNPRIKKMSVDVFAPGSEENPIISLDTFVYSQKKKVENE